MVCSKCNHQEMQKHNGLGTIAREEYGHDMKPERQIQHDIRINYVLICPSCGFTEIYSKLRENV